MKKLGCYLFLSKQKVMKKRVCNLSPAKVKKEHNSICFEKVAELKTIKYPLILSFLQKTIKVVKMKFLVYEIKNLGKGCDHHHQSGP